MFFGEVPYTEMYSANSKASATFFAFFILIFCFFAMNTYTAIIIETYQKLRVQKLLLSEALARLIVRDTMIRFNNRLNLIILRQSQNDDNDENTNKNDSETEKKQTRFQIFKNNWAVIKQKEILTKEQFVINLKNMAQKMNNENIKKFQEKQDRLKIGKEDSKNSVSSYKILKRSFIWLIYILVSILFFLNQTNNREKW